MPLAIDELLRPVSEAEPCGPELRYEDDFVAISEQVGAVERPPRDGAAWSRVDWAREGERIEALARRGRDLRVWVWLTRSLLVTEGPGGLVSGLTLIAQGLDRYWDVLPPFDPDEARPKDRFMARLNALGELGASTADAKVAEIEKRRGTAHLLDDLRTGATRVPSDAAIGQALTQLDRIERIFRERFGGADDNPQLGFEVLRKALAGLGGSAPAPNGDATKAQPAKLAVAPMQGAVASREDVVRALNLVLEYYRTNEPASPVPLLVTRAKRLVNMSFMDAIKELAPGGLKELQTVAGKADDGKAEAKAG